MKLREGAEEATMPTKGQPKEATTSEDNSWMTEAHSNLLNKLIQDLPYFALEILSVVTLVAAA